MSEHIFKKTISGITYYSLRTIVVFPLSLVSLVALSTYLDPTDFGVFAAASFVVNFVSYFVDVGLSAAVIQRKQNIATKELQSVFCFQLLIGSSLFIGISIATPFLSAFYKLTSDGLQFIFLVAAIPLIFSPIASVSNAVLSRNLQFKHIALINLKTAIIYQVLIVFFAWYGLGVWSFPISSIASEIYSTIALYSAANWKIGIAWEKPFLKKAITFGGLYYLSGMTFIVRDNIIALLAAPIYGPQAAGFLKWSHKVSFIFSEKISNLVAHVSFPAFAKLQGDHYSLELMINKTLRYINIFSLLILGILTVFIRDLVELYFDNKWQPAIFSYYFFVVRMLSTNLITPLDFFIKSMGKAGLSLKFTSIWTLFDWILAILFMNYYGYNGIAIGYAVAGLFAAMWVTYYINRFFVNIHFHHVVTRPFIAIFLSALTVYVARAYVPINIVTICSLSIFAMIEFFTILFLLEKASFVEEILSDIRYIRSSINQGD